MLIIPEQVVCAHTTFLFIKDTALKMQHKV